MSLSPTCFFFYFLFSISFLLLSFSWDRYFYHPCLFAEYDLRSFGSRVELFSSLVIRNSFRPEPFISPGISSISPEDNSVRDSPEGYLYLPGWRPSINTMNHYRNTWIIHPLMVTLQLILASILPMLKTVPQYTKTHKKGIQNPRKSQPFNYLHKWKHPNLH